MTVISGYVSVRDAEVGIFSVQLPRDVADSAMSAQIQPTSMLSMRLEHLGQRAPNLFRGL